MLMLWLLAKGAMGFIIYEAVTTIPLFLIIPIVLVYHVFRFHRALNQVLDGQFLHKLTSTDLQS